MLSASLVTVLENECVLAGGAKLGVACDPRYMSVRMQERLTRKLTTVGVYNTWTRVTLIYRL
jgi:hypothetical protein